MSLGLPARIEAKISPEPNSGCWLWTGALNRESGYGMVWFGGGTFGAHRVVYRLLRGEIPENLEPDHTCRMCCCVNPDHINLVTHRENLMRSTSWATTHAAQTHCKHGHSLHDAHINARGGRDCRVCALARAQRYKQKKGKL